MKKLVKKPSKSKVMYMVDMETDPKVGNNTVGFGDTLEQAVEDFRKDNGNLCKIFAFKLELLGEVKQTLEIVK